ncbi:terminase small subunit [Enterobacter hormaechei]|uniref:terminase small subunit n=1 Tax=Enterobacter hormaechei TaxID=158836 RepID=UPI002A7501E4|nr:terminase small subunit [Enterobacter hormaechei]MDY3572324.1 terminase small subunit [Enterobacter hormaechei]
MSSQEEVAAHLNLDARQIRRLQQLPGAPKTKGRGNYDLDAWRYFYLAYLSRGGRDISAGGEGDDDYEQKLLISRWQLTEEQALAQRLKNQVTERRMVDSSFCSFALSRLAEEISGILDNIPLSMQRQFPSMTTQQIDFLKLQMAKAANKCARVDEALPGVLDEYYRLSDS